MRAPRKWGLECIKGGLDFPALMVKCCQPWRWRLFWKQGTGVVPVGSAVGRDATPGRSA